MRYDHSNRKYQHGFSLAEVVAALFVFMIGAVAMLSLVSASLRESKRSEGRLTAIYLAQEGIELVRNIRDQNWINGRSWRSNSVGGCNLGVDESGTPTQCDYDLDDTVLDPSGYIVDYRTGGLGNYEDIFLCFYYDDGRTVGMTARPIGYAYDHISSPPCQSYAGGYESKYKRTIYLEKISDSELKVRSVVRWGGWTSPADFQTFEVAEHLTDWNRQNRPL
jgi:hypothetical protein